MTYVVHKKKAVEDAKKVKDEIENKNRQKRKLELDYERKCLEAMKNAFDDADGGGMDEIEYELQVLFAIDPVQCDNFNFRILRKKLIISKKEKTFKIS